MNARVPAEVFPPGEFLKEELEARGWTQVELAEILARPPRLISELVSGKRAITPETAQGLAAAFEGTTAQYWMNLETSYRLATTQSVETDVVSRRAKLYGKFPVKELLRRRWVEPSDNLEVLEQRFLDFFCIKSLDETPEFKHAAKKVEYTNPDSLLQLAWLIRAKRVAKTVTVGRFSINALEMAMAELRSGLSDINTIKRVPAILAKAGVSFVIVEFLPSAKLDGACFWIDEIPVIALSLRYDRVDNFWHTLFHELDHVKHGDGKDTPIVDDFESDSKKKNLPARERRANEAATNCCIPKAELEAWLASSDRVFSRNKIMNFARQVGVHPALVVGQLQRREVIPWSFHRELLEKVRTVVSQLSITDGFGNKLVL